MDKKSTVNDMKRNKRVIKLFKFDLGNINFKRNVQTKREQICPQYSEALHGQTDIWKYRMAAHEILYNIIQKFDDYTSLQLKYEIYDNFKSKEKKSLH